MRELTADIVRAGTLQVAEALQRRAELESMWDGTG